MVIAVALFVAACGGSADPTAAGRSPDTGEPTAPGSTPATLSGTLGGDADLEGGCAWLDTDRLGRVEPRWPDGYTVAFDPVRLLGRDGQVVAEEGDRVSVDGAVAEEVMTICQVGPVLDVSEILEVRGS